jgi:uncharacterized protein YukJ
MALTYGFVKCTVAGAPQLQSSRKKNETQYHLHVPLQFTDAQGNATQWDSAINVGTNDADDLLRYRLAFDFHHAILQQVQGAPAGFNDLTATKALPALDFLRSDVLAETGAFRDTDVMDGSEQAEPIPTLLRLFANAQQSNAPVYLFGRTYSEGGGIHDVHMNQGSTAPFLNNGVDDHNDHNDTWQDGGVIVDLGTAGVAAYFTAFTQQHVPTDSLGNPGTGAHEITDADPGTLAA